MSSNLKKCLAELQLVAKIKDKKRQAALLRELARNNCFEKSIHEIAVNTVNKNIPLTTIQKKKLRKYKTVITKLSCKDKSERKKVIPQIGGALNVLLPIVASILASLV